MLHILKVLVRGTLLFFSNSGDPPGRNFWNYEFVGKVYVFSNFDHEVICVVEAVRFNILNYHIC